MVDALEDDLVKKFEKESQEKLKNKTQTTNGSSATQEEAKAAANGPVDNFKIFERHYEDGKEEQEETKGQNEEGN